MDPNATLALIRGLVQRYNETVDQYQRDQAAGGGGGRDYEDYEDGLMAVAQELVPLVEALDEWLSRGGFPPEAWREGPDAPEEGLHILTGDGGRRYLFDGATPVAQLPAEPLGPTDPAGVELPE